MDLDPSLTLRVDKSDSQCRHDEVGGGVNSVGGLHPVGAPDPGHPRVPVQVHVELELADEVK